MHLCRTVPLVVVTWNWWRRFVGLALGWWGGAGLSLAWYRSNWRILRTCSTKNKKQKNVNGSNHYTAFLQLPAMTYSEEDGDMTLAVWRDHSSVHICVTVQFFVVTWNWRRRFVGLPMGWGGLAWYRSHWRVLRACSTKIRNQRNVISSNQYTIFLQLPRV